MRGCCVIYLNGNSMIGEISIYIIPFLLCNIAVGHKANEEPLNFNDPKIWDKTCNHNNMQSPIDINFKDSIKKSYQHIEYINFHKDIPIRLHNDGTGLEGEIQEAYVSGGPFTTTFTVKSFFFLWRSQHAFNGKFFPLELCINAIESGYPDYENAVKDGAALSIAIMYDVMLDSAPYMDKITSRLPQLTDTKTRLVINTHLNSLMPYDQTKYFVYKGSGTRPHALCVPGVKWLIFANPCPITFEQLYAFGNLTYDNKNLNKRGYRFLQPTNGRPIYYHSGITWQSYFHTNLHFLFASVTGSLLNYLQSNIFYR